MKTKSLLQIALLFLPGLGLAVLVMGWGATLTPPTYPIPQWEGSWIEPGQPDLGFKSWQSVDNGFLGETEPWPHKHPRANSYLRSVKTYAEPVAVDLDVTFQRGRYLGCYLCYDPKSDSGYWLSTGHKVGKYPCMAYIKIVNNGKWETQARAPLPLELDTQYQLRFQRLGNQLAVIVDGETIVTWEDETYHEGVVQLRLHNTKVAVHDIAVTDPSLPTPTKN